MPTPPPNRPLRVLYCTDTYPPQVNGVSVVTALSVAGLLQRGWEVGVIGPAYPHLTVDPFASTNDRAHPAPTIAIPSIPLPGYPDVRLAAPAWRTIARTIDEFSPTWSTAPRNS